MGSELAAALHENSFRVAVNYRRSEARAGEIVGKLGSSSMAVRADVSVYPEVLRMADDITGRWGRLDVLINNAGITRDSLLIKQGEKDWDSVMDVNLKGVFNSIKAFVPLMKEGGHIINISSYSGLKGKEGQAAYSASKAALLGLTRTAARELAEKGIRVNAVLPGFMPTAMGAVAGNALEKAKQDSLLNTLSDPGEVARFVVYLAGTRNITGQVFCLDSRII